jgi:hypothetical protein
VLEEHRDMIREDLRIAGRAAAMFYGGVLLAAVPTWLAIGGTDLVRYLVAHLFWTGAFVAALVTMWRRTYLAALAMYVLSLGAAVWLSGIFSPLVLVPGLLVAHASGFATVSRKRIRAFVFASTALAFLFSLAGASLGLLPETMHVVNGDLVIHTDVFRWTESSALVYLGLTTLAAVVAPSIIIGRLTRTGAAGFEELLLQRWQLHHITGSVRPPRTP